MCLKICYFKPYKYYLLKRTRHSKNDITALKTIFVLQKKEIKLFLTILKNVILVLKAIFISFKQIFK